MQRLGTVIPGNRHGEPRTVLVALRSKGWIGRR
jgi:hypothetical protein